MHAMFFIFIFYFWTLLPLLVLPHWLSARAWPEVCSVNFFFFFLFFFWRGYSMRANMWNWIKSNYAVNYTSDVKKWGQMWGKTLVFYSWPKKKYSSHESGQTLWRLPRVFHVGQAEWPALFPELSGRYSTTLHCSQSTLLWAQACGLDLGEWAHPI